MNLLCKLFSGSYENIWKALIRPTRDKYTTKELGPYKFELNSKNYKRTDLIIPNKRHLNLICSFWEPFDEERDYDQLPCVIYLHGNSSSRLEAIGQLKYLLPLNITVFAFDFSGCGKSEGEYISLGLHESDDVECVINYLLKTNKVSTIGLWARSMGAVTALIYASRENNHLSAILLDSAFFSLKKLIEEIIEKNINMPNFILNSMFETLRKTILEKAYFDIVNIEPYLYAKNCNIPAFFCHGKDDALIDIHHCKDLYTIYPGEKHMIILEGNHNSPRDIEFKNNASLFFYHNLNIIGLKNKNIDNIDNNISLNNSKNNGVGKNSIHLKNHKSYSFKTKINLDNNITYNNNLKDNINEKNENEKEVIKKSNRNIINYFQKCSSNDLNKINENNKKSNLNKYKNEQIFQNSSAQNIKKITNINDIELKQKNINFNNIKKLRTASISQNIYFKKNIHNPFIKYGTKINPLSNNCNLLNDMRLINNKIKHNNRYKSNDPFNSIESKNNTINNNSMYRKNSRKINIAKSNNANIGKNPFLFKFSNINKNENEKQQKSFYSSKLYNTTNIRNNEIPQKIEKKWVIFEGINPYLYQNKNYFKKKPINKDNSLDDDNNNTIKNEDNFFGIDETIFNKNIK